VPPLEPASLIREARQRAGLSQVELGRRAGVTQSLVSAYESGARQPSVPMLDRLVRASGAELEILLLDRNGALHASDGRATRNLLQHKRKLRRIIANYGLANPRVFGSVARGDDSVDSDLDILVDVPQASGSLTWRDVSETWKRSSESPWTWCPPMVSNLQSHYPYCPKHVHCEPGDRQRLDDILAAIDAIKSHTRRGDITDELVFDAVRVRLIDVGEAVKSLPAEVLANEPESVTHNTASADYGFLLLIAGAGRNPTACDEHHRVPAEQALTVLRLRSSSHADASSCESAPQATAARATENGGNVVSSAATSGIVMSCGATWTSVRPACVSSRRHCLPAQALLYAPACIADTLRVTSTTPESMSTSSRSGSTATTRPPGFTTRTSSPMTTAGFAMCISVRFTHPASNASFGNGTSELRLSETSPVIRICGCWTRVLWALGVTLRLAKS
jgi:uncharacterized protein